MELKPVIIGNVFCLVEPESGECITYKRDGMRERFARWKLRHKTNDPLVKFIPTIEEIVYAEYLYEAAYSCLLNEVSVFEPYVAW